MSESVGNVSFQGDGARSLYSDETAQMIDTEVRNFLTGAYERTRTIVAENAAKIDQIAELLLERETLVQTDVESILGTKAIDVTSKAPTRTAAAIIAETAAAAAAASSAAARRTSRAMKRRSATQHGETCTQCNGAVKRRARNGDALGLGEHGVDDGLVRHFLGD
jgi:septal ring factor EnvC (AmiA/AmiB activator)